MKKKSKNKLELHLKNFSNKKYKCNRRYALTPLDMQIAVKEKIAARVDREEKKQIEQTLEVIAGAICVLLCKKFGTSYAHYIRRILSDLHSDLDDLEGFGEWIIDFKALKDKEPSFYHEDSLSALLSQEFLVEAMTVEIEKCRYDNGIAGKEQYLSTEEEHIVERLAELVHRTALFVLCKYLNEETYYEDYED